ncbi:Anoctamin-7 [Rhizophlyctis rosea]|nr:Anoctamin-7 [Rhizophlyctis rosea]
MLSVIANASLTSPPLPVDTAGPKYIHADAIIDLIFGADRYDYILCYMDNLSNQFVRDRYERSLLKAGLIVEREQNVERKGKWFTKVIAPFWTLAREAERTGLMLPVKRLQRTWPNVHNRETSRLRRWMPHIFRYHIDPDHFVVPFRISELHQFEGGDAQKGRVSRDFFSEAHRTRLTFYLIEQPSRSAEMRQTADADGTPGFDIDDTHQLHDLLETSIYTDAYNTHHHKSLPLSTTPTLRTRLFTKWASKHFHPQPLEDIRNYFGEKVMLYFAFFGMFNVMLCLASVVGVAVFVAGVVGAFQRHDIGPHSNPWRFMNSSSPFMSHILESVPTSFDDSTTNPWQHLPPDSPSDRSGRWEALEEGFFFRLTFDNPVSPYFAFLMCTAALCLVKLWQREERYWAFRNGMENCEEDESVRPAFRGTHIRISLITGLKETYFPRSHQLFRHVVAWMITLLWVGIALCNVVGVIEVEKVLEQKGWSEMRATLLMGVWAFLSIVSVRKGYLFVARRVNDWMNWRTWREWEDALIWKIFLFDFVNFFGHAFYMSFIRHLYGERLFGWRAGCSRGECSTGLNFELFVVFTGLQLLDRFRDLAWPVLKSLAKRSPASKPAISSNNSAWSGIIIWGKGLRRARAVSRTRDRAWPVGKQDGLEVVQSKEEVNDDVQDLEEVTIGVAGIKRRGEGERRDEKRVEMHYEDYHLHEYEGTIENYNIRAAQFGFVVLFAAHFPLAPLFALLNNIFELRLTAYTLLQTYRRPIPTPARTIGTFLPILTFLAHLSVLTNSLIIAFISMDFRRRYIKRWATDGWQGDLFRVTFVMGFQWAVHLIAGLVVWMVGGEVKGVRVARRRRRWAVRTGGMERGKRAV